MFERPLIAIDIGSSSIKVLELSGGERRRLKSMGLEVLPPGAVSDGEIREPQIVQRALAGLLRKMGIFPRGRLAAISLGGSRVIIKRALITPAVDESMTEEIYYEAEQLFQHDLTEMYFRYKKLDSKRPGAEADKRPYLLVGAKRDVVEQHLAVVRAVGLRVGVVDCDLLCLANMFGYNYPVANTLLATVNIGATSTQVIITYDGEFLFSREFSIGGQNYTERVARELEVDYQSAESLKIASSLGTHQVSSDIHRIIDVVNEELIEELKTTFSFFFSYESLPRQLNKINYIFLTGGGARLVGLDAAIAAHMQVPVQVINPFHRIDVKGTAAGVGDLHGQAPLYGNAVGLALRRAGDDI